MAGNHRTSVYHVRDGRWFDEQAATWRDRRGRMARWPDLVEARVFPMTRVVLAAAHLETYSDLAARSSAPRSALPRCIIAPIPGTAQRRITYRRRQAIGHLFLGPYATLIGAQTSCRAASSATFTHAPDGKRLHCQDYQGYEAYPVHAAGNPNDRGWIASSSNALGGCSRSDRY